MMSTRRSLFTASVLVGSLVFLVPGVAVAQDEPAAVTDVTAFETGFDSIRVRWTPVTDDDGGAPLSTVAADDEEITMYTVLWKEGSTPITLADLANSRDNADEDATQFDITGLKAGTAYEVAVVAVNGNGNSAVETASQDGATTDAGVDPDRVTQVELEPGDGMLTVMWTAPYAGDDSLTIKGYSVRYRMSSATSWTMFPHSGTETMAIITGLTNMMEYDVQVAATNSLDEMGPYSRTMSETVGMDTDTTDTTDTTDGQMMTMAASVNGSYLAVANTFGVTWTPAADADQQYVVLFSLPDYTRLGIKVLGGEASSHEFVLDDPAPAGDYEVLVATVVDDMFHYDDSTTDMVTVE
jgi:hypothetical protein